MNILTVKKKLSICEITTYLYKMERQERLTRLGTLPTFQNVLNVLNIPEHTPKLPNLNFGRRSAAILPKQNCGRNTIDFGLR